VCDAGRRCHRQIYWFQDEVGLDGYSFLGHHVTDSAVTALALLGTIDIVIGNAIHLAKRSRARSASGTSRAPKPSMAQNAARFCLRNTFAFGRAIDSFYFVLFYTFPSN